MDADEFRRRGHEMVNYIADYYDSLRDRRVVSNVSPGYLRPLIPAEAPAEGESWDTIAADIDRVIMPGVTHWQSPHFHAYYPGASSFPAILGDMLSDAIACVGFSWVCSPACTELETIVLDWLGRAVGLPDAFLAQTRSGQNGHGGGIIQGTASEAVLVCLLAARAKAINAVRDEQLKRKAAASGADSASVTVEEEGTVMARLVAYGSDQTHSCIEKAARIAGIRYRILATDESNSLVPATLEKALKEDRDAGLIPFFLSATAGTTSTCAYDDIVGLGQVCNREDIWYHIDAAYAGSACVCPEYRHLINGVELADSFNFNPHKWLLVNFDCSTLWVKQRLALINAFTINPEYLKNAASESGLVTDYRNWQIPLGRRFRSLKLWFVLRSYGIAGLQAHIRKHVNQAKKFEELVLKDSRFEIVFPTTLSLVCFRLKGENELNAKLLAAISEAGQLFMIHTVVKGKFILRFVVGAAKTTDDDIDFAFNHISELATKLLEGK